MRFTEGGERDRIARTWCERLSRLCLSEGLGVPEVALFSGHRDFRMFFLYAHLRAKDIVGKLV